MKTIQAILFLIFSYTALAQPFVPPIEFSSDAYTELPDGSIPTMISCQENEEKLFKIKFHYEIFLPDADEVEVRIDTNKTEWDEADEKNLENKYNEERKEFLKKLFNKSKRDREDLEFTLRDDLYHYFNDNWQLERCSRNCDLSGYECESKLSVHYVDTTGFKARYSTSYSYIVEGLFNNQVLQTFAPLLIADGWVYFKFKCECVIPDDAISSDIDPSNNNQISKNRTISNLPDPKDYLINVIATGRASGKAATMTITNPTDKSMDLSFLPAEIESDGQHQGFINADTIIATVTPNTTISFNLNHLYCLQPELPIPESGMLLAPPNEWNTESHLISKLKEIKEEVDHFIDLGEVNLVFDPQVMKDLITQYLIWLFVEHTTFTPDQICELLIDNYERTTGKPVQFLTIDEKSILDYTLAIVLESIKSIGKNVAIPFFTEPELPKEAKELTPAPSSSHPEITETIKVTSTGQTTGRIGYITISNPTGRSIHVKIGNGNLYILIKGDQSMLISEIPEFSLAPREKKNIPLDGSFCADISELPMAEGKRMPDVSEWVGLPETEPSRFNTDDPDFVFVPTRTSLSVKDATDLLEELSQESSMNSYTSCIDDSFKDKAIIPGSEMVVPVAIISDDHPGLGVTLILDAYSSFKRSFIKLKTEGKINTVFSQNPVKEEMTVLQWLVWRYEQALRRENVGKEHFIAVGIKEIEQKGGKPLEEYPEEVQEEVVVELKNLHEIFDLVGTFAKKLKPGIDAPDPDEILNDQVEGFNPEQIKEPSENSDKTNDHKTIPDDRNEPPILISSNEKCACGPINLSLTIYKLAETRNNGRRSYNSIRGSDKTIEVEAATGDRSTHEINGEYEGLERGDFVGVIFDSVSADCACTDGSRCIVFVDRNQFIQWKGTQRELDRFMDDYDEKKTELEDKLKRAENTVDPEILSAKTEELEEAEKLLNELRELIVEYDEENDEDKKSEIKHEIQDSYARGNRWQSIETILRNQERMRDQAQTAYERTTRPITAAQENLDDLEQEKRDKELAVQNLNKEEIVINENGKRGNVLSQGSNQLSWIKQRSNDKLELTFFIGFYCGTDECRPTNCSRTFILKLEE